MMKIKLAENIKKLRKNHSLTQEQFAETLGVTVGAVYKWEAGLSTPEIKLIVEIADLFEVSIDALLGYEQQKDNIDTLIENMKQYMLEKNFREAELEAQKALKKYPNNFAVVYSSAYMYQLKFMEEKSENAMEQSNELFHKSISLLYQNTEKSINEASILNRIAENYLIGGKIEKALECLKQNNICGINNSLIGFIYAYKLKQPQEAKPFLIRSFVDIINAVIHTVAGLAYMYAELDDEASIEATLWLNDFLDSIKTNNNDIILTDKIKAAVLAQYAVWNAVFGHLDVSKEYITKAYFLAKQFDTAPIYSVQGIKFFKEENISATVYDGIGKTAMETVEKIIFDEETEATPYKYIQNIWKDLKKDELR